MIYPGTVTAPPFLIHRPHRLTVLPLHSIRSVLRSPQATLGSDQIFPRDLNMDNPTPKSPNSVGGPSPRPLSRPDFIRDFGLDIPEEEEPPEETDADNEEEADQDSDMDLVEAEADGD